MLPPPSLHLTPVCCYFEPRSQISATKNLPQDLQSKKIKHPGFTLNFVKKRYFYFINFLSMAHEQRLNVLKKIWHRTLKQNKSTLLHAHTRSLSHARTHTHARTQTHTHTHTPVTRSSSVNRTSVVITG